MSQVEQPSLPNTSSHQPPCASTRLPSAPADVPRNTTVLVSVVMPCLNEARTVAACIDQAHAGCRAALAKRNITAQTLIPSPHIPQAASTPSNPSPLAQQAASAPAIPSPLAPYSGRGAGGEGQLADDQSPSPSNATPPANQPVLAYEIIIADNGSTDGSQAIAEAHGARVVHVAQKGYGAALLGGFAAARGKYIVMGDSDCSYDFGEVSRFLDKLEEGYDLVMGNRFAGSIMPGAMPWHHRYIGNPLLSGLGRLLYRTPCRDWHCGLRAFDREKIQALNPKAHGMEFASEMVIRASQGKLRMGEIPIQLRPDGRSGPPHLRSFRDGLRHLQFLVLRRLGRTLELSVLIFCVLSCSISLWAIYMPESGGRNDALLLAKPANLSSEGVQGQLRVNILNKSEQEIVIRAIHTSCLCTVPGNHPKSLRPGEKFPLTITYDRTSNPGKNQYVYINYYGIRSKHFYRNLEIRIEGTQNATD